MNIGIIGASGNIGKRVLAEALNRGHQVTAFTRDIANATKTPADVVWKAIDVLDSRSVAEAIRGLDVLISTFQPGNASKDLNDTLERSIRNPSIYVSAAESLLRAMEQHPRLRLIVVGGAGSLEIRPGLTLADSPDLGEKLMNIGLPEAYEAAVRGHRDALNTYRVSNRLWSYASPAGYIYPGERTGRFRLGRDQFVIDANGQSRISFEDFAIALIDEAELPRHVQVRFTVGY